MFKNWILYFSLGNPSEENVIYLIRLEKNNLLWNIKTEWNYYSELYYEKQEKFKKYYLSFFNRKCMMQNHIAVQIITKIIQKNFIAEMIRFSLFFIFPRFNIIWLLFISIVIEYKEKNLIILKLKFSYKTFFNQKKKNLLKTQLFLK